MAQCFVTENLSVFVDLREIQAFTAPMLQVGGYRFLNMHTLTTSR